jgi:hypothetical protein
MSDMSGHGRPQQDSDQLRHTLTIHEVSTRLAAAGVPRSERSIKRYCETGFLDAKKVPGPSGEQWFVAPAALPKLIGDLQQWQVQREGHGRPQPATAGSVTPEKPNDSVPDTAGHGRPEQAMAGKEETIEDGGGKPATTGYVAQLERDVERLEDDRDFLREQIKVKDGQITSLLERDRETNILIGKLQEMLTPLLGAPERGPRVHDSPPPSDTAERGVDRPV